MERYNLETVHEDVGNAYSMAKDIQNPDLRESMLSGVVELAHQTRAAEELDDTGLFELAEAMEYGVKGMGDIYIASNAADKQAQDYRETFADLMSGESSPFNASPEEIRNNMDQFQELQGHLEQAEKSQRDTARTDRIEENAADAYGTSLGVLINEEDSLRRRHESKLTNGNDNARLATLALQELNPEIKNL